MTIWLPIVGYEGYYEVSNAGVVRGRERLDSRGRKRQGKVLSPRTARSGHKFVALNKDGIRKSFGIHELVLTAFVGPRPPGLHVCHWNDDPRDNSIGNLRWDTRSENTLDSVRNGTHSFARKTHCPQGHPYSVENTYKSPSGSRNCQECRRQYREDHREQRRQSAREYMRRKRAQGKQKKEAA